MHRQRWPSEREGGSSSSTQAIDGLEFAPLVVTGEGGAGEGLSLEAIQLSDREGGEGQGMQQLSHQLCEQLR